MRVFLACGVSSARSSVVNATLRGFKEQRSFKPQAEGSIPSGRTMSEHRTYNALYDAAVARGHWIELVSAKHAGLCLLRVANEGGVIGEQRIISGLDEAAAKLLPLTK